MPNLPGSTAEIDNKMFDRILDSDDLHADQWKIYPCEITPWTVIKKWAETGEYIPYNQAELEKVLIRCKSKMKPWIRLNRVVRDIPSQYVLKHEDDPNLRQTLLRKMKEQGLKCRCIRCREIRGDLKANQIPELVIRKYRAGKGLEYFISFELNHRERICGFIRLRICDNPNDAGANIFQSLKGCALIRELHVYGQIKTTYKNQRNIYQAKKKVPQHIGLGRKLMKKAEEIALYHNYKRIAVIAGVGVRDYYQKLGYQYNEETDMMIKNLIPSTINFLQKFLLYIVYVLLLSIILKVCFDIDLVI